jgi:CDP-2,3-bis-(O-geranylgeranyl)-sn-glycerol synthase
MHSLIVLQLLILLTLANGSPVVARRILGGYLAHPIDGNVAFFDGRPLFGSSKTTRGVLGSIVVTSASALLLGLDLKIGLIVGVTAMGGDLLSSFLKRRLGLPPSSRAIGLDQIPESLIPVLACRHALSLTAVDILAVTVIFFVGELALSRLLYKFRLRDRPY